MNSEESIESKIKREAELAAIELELERRMPGFTGPVRKKESIVERRKQSVALLLREVWNNMAPAAIARRKKP